MNVPSAEETTATPFVIFNASEPQPGKEEIMIELYELAATGTPCIAIISNDNQFEDTLGFEKIGFLKNCGFYKTDN